MRVAIVHYHLRIGGVSTVIGQAARVLTSSGIRVCVITGEPPAEKLSVPVAVVPELAYGAAGPRVPDVIAKMDEAASRLLGGAPELWHIHNHSLGKNLAMPAVVGVMAGAGRPLLLQMHDFAEDGRPGNYGLLLDGLADGDQEALGPRLYPRAANVHYAFLNRRDMTAFAGAGLPDTRAHYLPNAVEAPPPAADICRRSDLVIYPTRAIRRKNVGELVLWAALERDGRRFALTRAPRNPEHAAVYKRWVEFSSACRLPVEFGLAEKSPLSFPELMRSAACAITTSVAEGFGLAFLEPWLMDCPLAGRALPEITGTFKEEGIDLAQLYDRLDVPLEWVGAENFRGILQRAMQKVYEGYRRILNAEDAEKAYSAAVREGCADFGRLDEDMQQSVISHILKNPSAASRIRPPKLSVSDSVVSRNKSAVLEKYGSSRYAARLQEIYRTVMESGAGSEDALNAGRVLDQFLLPERFNLLRT